MQLSSGSSAKRQTGLMQVKTSCCSAPAGWKSHLAAAIVDGVVGQGYRARFYSAGELLQELRKAELS
jgi:hypothetical protein